MFRLLKLALYVVVGYAIYEFFVGLTEGRAEQPAIPSTPPHKIEKSPMGGVKVAVRDGTGVRRTQSVGRGVVS